METISEFQGSNIVKEHRFRIITEAAKMIGREEL